MPEPFYPSGEFPYEENKYYFVLAQNYHCFRSWQRRHGLVGKRNVLYIDRYDQIRGYSPSRVTVVDVCDKYPLAKSNGILYNRYIEIRDDIFYYYGALVGGDGVPAFFDTCIENAPTERERLLHSRQRRLENG